MKALLILLVCLFAVPMAGTILLQLVGAVAATGVTTRVPDDKRTVGRAAWRIVDRGRPSSMR
jgi:hypothetical protein